MIKNSKKIIAIFSVLFLLLIGIQSFFMYKTYLLKEKEIYRIVQKKLKDYTDDLEDKGGIDKASNDELQRIFVLYKSKKIDKNEFLNYFENIRKRNIQSLNNFLDTAFQKEGYKVAIKITYLSIISEPDDLSLIDKPIVLFETENKLTKPESLSMGSWRTSSSSKNDENGKILKEESFQVKSETVYQILNIKQVVFKELWALILCCILILAAVLWIFILTIKNLIQQQKQIEILHVVVDNISHEFKTPIATLKIASKSLKKNFNEDNLPLIDRQIARLESLMKQLNSSGNEVQNNEYIEVEDWVFFINDLKINFPEVEFIIENLESKEIIFPKSEMESIIKNLAENAAKYGASKVNIFINEQKSNLEIEVSDNGIGIPKSEQDNIFEKFYRMQSNNIHNAKGLGLGLFLVKNIIEKHSGSISLESEVNKGSIFKIKLPYES